MLHLRTLGTLDLRDPAGHPVQSVLAQPRRVALLVYLAIAVPRGLQRRDTLLALLWPESDAERGRGALSQALYFLRRSLSESVVASRGTEEIGVDPAALECDAVLFEEALRDGRTEEAMALYGGGFLDGFHLPDAPEFERWAELERERLRARAVRAAWELADREAMRQAADAAAEWGHRAVTLSGHDEAAVRRLMSLLARIGERGQALRVYDDLVRRLAREAGDEPEPESTALAASLRERPSPPPPAATVPAGPSEERLAPLAVPVAVPVPAWAVPMAAERRPRTGIVAALIAAAGVVALGAMLILGPVEEERIEPIRTRVVVAELENRTDDPSLDPLGGMAADWITMGLQETGMVEVIDPVTAFVSTRNLPPDSAIVGYARAGALARETRAGTVVWGSFYQTGDTLRFSVTISDVGAASRARRLTVSGIADDPSTLVQELRQRVAGALAGGLDLRVASLSGIGSTPPRLDAYREYAEGLELFARNEYAAAYPRLLQAAELDSTFLLPRFWALFALGNRRQYATRDSLLATLVPLRDRLSPIDRHSLDYFLADSRRDRVEALRAARQAARLAPQSNWTYMVGYLALLLNRPRESLAALTQLDPDRGWAKGWTSYWSVRAGARHHLGQHDEELADALRARSIDPADPDRIGYQISALAALGQVVEARALLDTLVALPPRPLHLVLLSVEEIISRTSDELRAHGHPAAAAEVLEWDLRRIDELPKRQRGSPSNRFRRAYDLSRLERTEEAEEAARDCLAHYPEEIGCTWLLGALAARRGARPEAERQSARLQVLADSRGHLSNWALVRRAAIAARLGDSTRAAALIAEAITRGSGVVALLHADPDLAPLRGYPPFEKILKPEG